MTPADNVDDCSEDHAPVAGGVAEGGPEERLNQPDAAGKNDIAIISRRSLAPALGKDVLDCPENCLHGISVGLLRAARRVPRVLLPEIFRL